MNEPEKKKPFLDIFEELSKIEEGQNGHRYPGLKHETVEEDEEEWAFEENPHSLTDEIDHQILMHRDAHFGGDFSVMLNYYQAEDGVGINPEFDIERIAYLADVESQLGHDLAPLILSGSEAEQVAQARKAYTQLKEIYAIESPSNHLPRLITDLILSEEEEPEQEIEAVVAHGTHSLPETLAILKSEDAYNPLFPGYGYAPYLAIICLGKIGDSAALIPIFEVLSKEMLFDELVILEAFAQFGLPAQEFLLKILKSRPLTQDNTHAAFALTAFAHDISVAIACFEQLKDPEVREHALLRTYLLCNCEALAKSVYKEDFIRLSDDPSLPSVLRSEMKNMIEDWK